MDSLALVAGVNGEVTRSLHHRVVTLIPSTLDANEVVRDLFVLTAYIQQVGERISGGFQRRYIVSGIFALQYVLACDSRIDLFLAKS